MNPEENAEKNTFVAHYLNEWSMWMDTHPEGLKRTTEKNNADENSADDAGESLWGRKSLSLEPVTLEYHLLIVFVKMVF